MKSCVCNAGYIGSGVDCNQNECSGAKGGASVYSTCTVSAGMLICFSLQQRFLRFCAH
eukprot:NODE_18106_length_177_cov_0.789062_g17491_i0.p2 GENE.NODE_18106_length_177_cov_0.789062_g17491_i0~~NODE_18106_length_177_cov_0.789062_g17491_i0.p2  ORF type:complete len:58 (-),score=2.90 NODE_18106_length_177_cov_0.789062_g17491_i0:4-177(-)